MAILKALVLFGVMFSKVLAIEGSISLDATAQTWPLTSTIAVKVASRSKGLHRRLDQPTQNGKPISTDVANLQIRYAPIEIRCKFDQWSVASTQHIQEGIDYISKITKKPELGPGPDKCTRSLRSLDLNSFQYIARSARAIVKECGDEKRGGTVLGQAKMPDDWNVIIRQDAVDC
ncbi:hypothetical protein E4U57_004073 [Claviceps arundinis]|uniref:Ecp2 effector protein domain-containing protein n=1 Tax=Claviceps arundinis TaxID=1623583 RepID=A0A9P7MWC6_9HYPO|nr:hypothetical protein E4U57_004073 [Claviceps arundinis]KAG5972565.1 hypothetical protein E4U56_005893 [Claviceps arundinis]